MNNHTCDAVVVFCIDFRFQKYIHNWLDKQFANKLYDYVGFAGGTKELETVLNQIAISVRLHDIKEVVLMHHENCGAYGAEGNPLRHAQDLQKAKKIILQHYPNLHVSLYYIHLNGEFEEVQ
jgi:carbonic anhydrase